MKLIYSSILLFCIWFTPAAKAQELKRRAFLGLHTSPLPDSLARAHNLENGLLVAAVAPGSTASALGIGKNDILLSVNKKHLSKPDDIAALNKTLYPHQVVTAQLLRGGKKKSLKGKAVGRTAEAPANANIVYSQVPFRGGHLRTITYKPKNGTKSPAILFIPGFPCRSIEDYTNTAYGQLIKGWSELGYLVMLVEKPGLGDNELTQDCMQIDLYTEIEAFEQGLLELKRLPEVDQENIFLFGHSMGGIVAPVISQKHRLKGVMVYGSPYRPWFEFAADMFRFQKPLTGTDYVESEETMRQLHHVLYRYFVLGQHPSTIAAADPAYKKILQEEFQYNGGDEFWSRDYRYWQQIDEINLTKAWAETEEYVLSIWGEYDFQVVNAEDHKRIAEIVNHYHPGNATFLTMPKTNHSFVIVPGMAEGVAQMNKRDPEYNRTHFNTKLIQDTDTWMKKVMHGTPE
ncbi:PDZ domain-containing protein [Pontibacter sp. FD36]|uniref:PDZ domain-containing protein n=1 Tax=Pontibacter sp. FD36 TaxID=2789860 RepID=UPI0018AA56D3|nr:PDZ domain-containing protein [Pontibacter sp. FD36]MBF8964066.1 PDZ domain-containing protein [Pontibacter sp. FD36]